MQKIVGTLEELVARRAAARAAGLRVVQCHGCFDIVHPGHIRHLKFARSQGDILLVTVSGDAVVAKGTGRPLIPQELRAENLAELDCVSWVYVEPSPTAESLLDAVRPDVYMKGREYEFNDDPRFKAERAAVERHGGRVVFSSGDVVFSSTALIESLTNTAARDGGLDPFHRRLVQLSREPELSGERLCETIGQFRGRRVVVVGEVIRDTYVFCDRPDVAGESPVMTLRPVEYRCFDGGAAILARHAAAMGADATLVTALPDDAHGAALRARLLAEGVNVLSIPSPTAIAEKQRFLVGDSKVMKVDLVDEPAFDAGARERLLELAGEAASHGSVNGGCDAAIVVDFGLGLLTPPLLRRLCTELRPRAGILAGDVSGRRSGLRDMRGMDLLTPSESELRDAMRNYSDGLPAVTWGLLNETHGRSAIVTMGPDGLIAFGRVKAEPAAPAGKGGAGGGWGGSFPTRLRGEHVPALVPHAVDALGCGDALLTTAALTLASGGSLLSAAYLGAVAASLEARWLGNVPVNASSLRREALRLEQSHVAMTGPGVLEAMPVVRKLNAAAREAG